MKRSPLKPKKSWKRMNPVSRNRRKDLKIYSKLRLEFLSIHLYCSVCRKQGSTEIHHMKGRGVYLNDQKYFLACCSECHRKITDNPVWARENVYSLDRLEKLHE